MSVRGRAISACSRTGRDMTETFAQYTARLLALAAGSDPLHVLASTPARIGELLAGRPSAALQRAPAPGKWSIAGIMSHLADSELVVAYRMRAILAAPGDPIQAYDQVAWTRAQHAERSDPSESLALLTAVRAANVRLMRGLTDEERDRYGIHSERGEESIRKLLTLQAGHDRNHLAQIERILH